VTHTANHPKSCYTQLLGFLRARACRCRFYEYIPHQQPGFLKGILSVLMIRLARFGARKQPYYRVVVIEKDRARNGRSVEVVGTYNPRTNPATVDIKRERVDYWTGKGAQLSDTVAKLLKTSAAPAA
jgi:small subunit ribosomal protein S16